MLPWAPFLFEVMAATHEGDEADRQQAVTKTIPTHIASMGPMITLYPVSCIKKRTKGKQFEKDRSVAGRFARQEQLYYEEGIRRTVDAILLVHDHGHPHVLMLHIDHRFWKLYVFAIQSIHHALPITRNDLTLFPTIIF
jgi:hypothetical protein